MASFSRRLEKLEGSAIRNADRLQRELLALATDEELDQAIEILGRRNDGRIMSVQDENRLAEIAANLYDRLRLSSRLISAR